MKELLFVRPGYETRGEDPPVHAVDAHRIVRMALAIGNVLGTPYELHGPAADTVVRIEEDIDSDEVRFSPEDATTLVNLLLDVQRDLSAALDDQDFPTGPGGELIRSEALEPTRLESGQVNDDRVFSLEPDGRISTLYPRMSIGTFRDQLPAVIALLQRAATQKLEVALVG